MWNDVKESLIIQQLYDTRSFFFITATRNLTGSSLLYDQLSSKRGRTLRNNTVCSIVTSDLMGNPYDMLKIEYDVSVTNVSENGSDQ